jgi:NitT/TauT family transport system ATP-binding protein
MPFLSVTDLTVRFPVKNGRQHTVFSGLNLDISEGEFVCIVGQTGCGKSTLLKVLLGSERPSSGTASLDGKPFAQPCRDRGYVPQKYSLFPDKTVLQNVAFGPIMESFGLYKLAMPSWWRQRRTIRDESMQYLKRVGLSERDAAKYPDQLSGGMQQRVAIAQSLIMKPKILLMDEAFSALDPATRTEMQRLIRSIWKETGTTVVFVTHNLAEAVYLSSRIILLAPNEERECSRIALDLNIPDYVRKPDGYPRQSDLERIIHEIESAAMGGRLEQEMAEFGG